MFRAKTWRILAEMPSFALDSVILLVSEKLGHLKTELATQGPLELTAVSEDALPLKDHSPLRTKLSFLACRSLLHRFQRHQQLKPYKRSWQQKKKRHSSSNMLIRYCCLVFTFLTTLSPNAHLSAGDKTGVRREGTTHGAD